MYGHDNSRTSFTVQMPNGRHVRREERVFQLLRMFNGQVWICFFMLQYAHCVHSTLSRKKESQKRHLRFHVPVAIPVQSTMRLIQSDSSYVSMMEIYEQFCAEKGIAREDPLYMVPEKLRPAMLNYKQTTNTYVSYTLCFVCSHSLTWCYRSPLASSVPISRRSC